MCPVWPALAWPCLAYLFFFYYFVFSSLSRTTRDENDKSMDLFTSKWFQIGFYEPMQYQILHTQILLVTILSIVAICGPFQLQHQCSLFSFYVNWYWRFNVSLLSIFLYLSNTTAYRSVTFRIKRISIMDEKKKKKCFCWRSYENFSIWNNNSVMKRSMSKGIWCMLWFGFLCITWQGKISRNISIIEWNM